jgi:tRNA-dihydrouridine synthase
LSLAVREQIGLLIAYGKRAKENEGESYSLVMTRKLLSGMLKGVRGASSLRQTCSSRGNWDSLEEVLAGFARYADS